MVLWLLFTAVPHYATAAFPLGHEPSLNLENLDGGSVYRVTLNDESVKRNTEIGNSSNPSWATEAVYSIDAHIRNTEVNPGDPVEIDIYLSGYGIPAKNKLLIIWSSPYVINEDDPGNITTTIKNYDINTETLTLGLTNIPLKREGNISGEIGEGFVLNLGFFAHPMSIIPGPFPQTGFKTVMGEWNWNGNPPILVKLNTRRDAPSGDYQVSLIFTYGNDTNPKQAFDVVQFHVKSTWDRWEPRVVVAGSVIAFIALIIAAAGTIWQMVRWRRGQ